MNHPAPISVFRSAVGIKPTLLPLYGDKVPAGFPSPADDYLERRLSLDEHLAKQGHNLLGACSRQGYGPGRPVRSASGSGQVRSQNEDHGSDQSENGEGNDHDRSHWRQAKMGDAKGAKIQKLHQRLARVTGSGLKIAQGEAENWNIPAHPLSFRFC